MVGVLGQFAPLTQKCPSASRPAAKTATRRASVTTRAASSEPCCVSSYREKTQKPSRKTACTTLTPLATSRARSTGWDEGVSGGSGLGTASG